MICVERLVLPDCLVPIHEIVKILEPDSILFVRIIPFLKFAICLRMFYPAFYMLDAGFCEKGLKPALAVFHSYLSYWRGTGCRDRL